MDKQTLSNYGWITICVLVLSVMIALATPFGSFIAGGFESAYEGFNATNEKALEIIKIHPQVSYYTAYVAQMSTQKVEFVFHEDGSVDIYGEDASNNWGSIFGPGSAVYTEGQILFDDMIFVINEDGSLYVEDMWDVREDTTFTVSTEPKGALKIDQVYRHEYTNYYYSELTFKANNSLFLEQDESIGGYVTDTYESDRYINHGDYFEYAYYYDEGGNWVMLRCAIHPSGNKIIVNGNAYHLVVPGND